MTQQQQPQQYVVKVNFTDEKGRAWSAGSAFTGEEEACKRLLATGKIEAERDEGQAQPKAEGA